jgi:ankyrin repeat protein
MLPPVRFGNSSSASNQIDKKPTISTRRFWRRFLDLPPEIKNLIISRKELLDDVLEKQNIPQQSDATIMSKACKINYLTRYTKHQEGENNKFLKLSLQKGHQALFTALLQTTNDSQLDLPPLINIAALKGDQAAFQKFLSVKTLLPKSTFEYVADCGQPAMLDTLEEKGQPIPKKLFEHAKQQQAKIKRLQALDKDKKSQKLLELVRSDTPNTPQIIALVRAGADAKAETDMGYTPLHLAAWQGHTALVQTLLNAGAEVDAKDQFDRTALHVALRGGHTELAQILLNAGAEVDAKDKYGFTPLHLAANEGHTALAQTLLNAGAEVDAKDKYGFTPLQEAARVGHLKLAERLLNAGADVKAENNDGKTPLYYALLYNHNTIADLLRQRGAAE